MYDQSSLLIAAILFLVIVLAIDLGFRLGRRRRTSETEAIKAQINAIQAATLGILALLLGFTFSLALQRHDSRSQAVVEEANAIGTAYLRAQLLPAAVREEVSALLRDYVDVRVRAGSVTMVDAASREPLLARAVDITAQLWRHARQAAELDGRSVATGLFIQALNDLIDAYGRRNAALDRHVPESVLFLMFATFLMASSILGYSSGIERHRAPFPTLMMVALIVVLTFLIVDLDRPRRGLIQVSQKSMEDLHASIAASPAKATPRR